MDYETEQAIHAASFSIPRRPSLQVRTRPTFSVVTSPAAPRRRRASSCRLARSVIGASARPSCSRTPRRVTSERRERSIEDGFAILNHMVQYITREGPFLAPKRRRMKHLDLTCSGSGNNRASLR